MPRDHREPDSAFRRRRLVVVLALVAGAVLLGLSLSVRPADSAFYPLTLGLAAVWLLGGLGSGPLHLGRIGFRGELRRPVLTPVLLGLLAVAVFVLGALAVREIEPLRDLTESVLAHARYGSLPLVALVTVLNGIAEEVFFRGALFAALGNAARCWPRPASTRWSRWPAATRCWSSPPPPWAWCSACNAGRPAGSWRRC